MAHNRYLVVSDLHLADIEDHADGWKRHKSSAWIYDDEFDRMVAAFEADGDPDDRLTLILNGDIFDFDLVTAVPDPAPWPVGPLEHEYGLAATAPKSAWKLERMLADHPRWIATLGRLCRDGHRVVLVIGNHDRELWFPAVTRVFVDAVSAVVGHAVPADRLYVEPWFFYVPGEIYVEHGHQYDYYSSFRYNLEPVYEMRGEQHLALTTGNLSNRFMLGNIGYFNPHATDFILSLVGYVKHWFRYYAFTRRWLMLTWFLGSVRSLAGLLNIRGRLKRNPPRDYDRHLDATAERYDIDPDTVRALYALRREPITKRAFKIFREFWLDRLTLAVLMVLGTVTLLVAPVPVWLKVMVPLTGFPLLWFIYQWLAGNDNALTLEQKTHTYAHAIASLVPVRAIVFGHTHVPNQIPLSRDVTFANSGTWAPIWDKEKLEHAAGLRNYVAVAVGEHGRCDVHLGSWMELHPGSAAAKSLSDDRPTR
ncbi:MAG: hypothetical protein CVU56_18115 [Deltaproteobacteria bacterium HGW-Deltaproteobacteria-14]|jgi:UDP-2,3-diacylglucosamine pyrophosphatase LpxH|nr:MAG: hypothetical protein CVU56_18115 [Deltaproteobacteria bacterium HGW-Deltaproteobacteria-14]